jgi:AcrR family transcriptional regulator
MSEDSPRQRMIQSAAMLMRERGVDATSFSEVIARSGAPRGSIYHHFPGGKEQLIEEATRWAGRFIASWQRNVLESSGPLGAVDSAAKLWKQLLVESDFSGGCPIVAATVSSDAISAAKDAAAEAFRGWQRPIADALAGEGVEAGRAEALGTLFVGAFEGAVILARADRSVAPVDRVASELRAAIAAALAGGNTARAG